MTFHPSPSRAGPTNTDGIWWHTGTLRTRGLQVDGSLSLPDGSIDTPMLAPNAVTELVGSYAQIIAWTLSADSVWTRLVLDLNRAKDVVVQTIEQSRELVAGFRVVFS